MAARLVLAALALFAAPQAGPPNVIVVITDDQGYGDLSCHGNPVLKTPHLDRLHAESVRLADFHVAPMCTPTRSQLLTGRDALANGAMNVSSGRTLLRRGIPTMAEIFAASGYRCGQFGKWHLGENHPHRPHDRGFHEAVYYPSSHIGSAPDWWENDYFDDRYRHNGAWREYRGYTTDVFFDEAMKWMKAQAGKPFFCYLATATAHGPLYVPQKYRDLYPGQPRNVASFLGMVANIDENMGRLDAFLRENGLRENTIVVFMTDNGGTVGVPLYNAGLRGRKIDLWDGGHRVPCFLRWPAGGLRPPGDVSELTQVQDLLPTLIDLCALKRPEGASFDGLSLAPILRGKEERLPDRTLVIQFSRMNAPVPKKGDACVLWKRWRLVSDRELYDLSADPGQKENAIEKHPEIAARLRAHYETWWARVEPRMNEFSSIVVGSDRENPSLLSPADWQDVFIDQSRQVRMGEPKAGPWGLEVASEGDYEIALRRWPEESGLAIRAGCPATQVTDGQLVPGKALPVAKARVRIGDLDETRPVAEADKAVVFTTRLKAGPARLETWFLNDAGKVLCGAYSVTVLRK